MYKRGEGVDRFGDGWSPVISYANPYGDGWGDGGSGVQGGDGSDDYARILYDEEEEEESEVK